MSQHHVHVKVWKRNHPTAVMFATFVIGSFLIYQVEESAMSDTDLYYSLDGSQSSSPASSSRCCWWLPTPSSTLKERWENKIFLTDSTFDLPQTLVIKGPFWKKKKEIELEPNEASVLKGPILNN